MVAVWVVVLGWWWWFGLELGLEELVVRFAEGKEEENWRWKLETGSFGQERTKSY